MTSTTLPLQDFLASTSPFDQLSPASLKQLCDKLQPLRYRMGQAIVVRETMPAQIAILYSGQARLLGYAPQSTAPVTLQLLKPGEVLGWASLVRGIPCETAIASIEAICLTLSAADFLALLESEPLLAAALSNRCALIEVFDLLGAELERTANGAANLKDLAISAVKEAVVLNLPPGKTPLFKLDPNLMWLLSGGAKTNFAIGSRITTVDSQAYIEVERPGKARLVGLRQPTRLQPESTSTTDSPVVTPIQEIPYAPERPEEPETNSAQARLPKYPYVHGRGPLDATLACFQMLSQHLGMPFRRDVLRRALANQFDSTGSISLQLCGAIAELMGLQQIADE